MAKWNNKSKIGMIVFLLVVIVAVIILFSSSNTEQDEIKIGVLAPLTGPLSEFGEYMKSSFDMALEEINSEGGINGKTITFIYEDTGCINLAGTTSALTKFKNIDNVVSVLGPFCGGTTHLAGRFSTDNDIFIINSGDNFGRNGDYLLGTRYLIKDEGSLLAQYVVDQGWDEVGILYYNNEWGSGYKNAIGEELEKTGAKFVREESYTFENLDVRTSLTKIANTNPDTIIIIDSTTGDLFKQVYELGIDIPLLSEWEIEIPVSLGNVDASLEEVVYFYPVTEETEFHQNFRERYGESPTVVSIDAYDAAKIMFESIKNCPDYNNDCMLDHVTSLKDYPGAGGLMTFDKERWGFEKKFVKKTIKNGKPIVLE